MAHYQLSYGFNSNDNDIATANGNNIITTKEIKTTEVQNKYNSTQEPRINVSDEKSSDKSEVEKRKLPPQSSEPGKNSTQIFISFLIIIKYD